MQAVYEETTCCLLGNALDNKEDVRAWLNTKEYDEEVGDPADPQGCPLYNYLVETFGTKDVLVDTLSYDDGCKGYDMPEWAADWQCTMMAHCIEQHQRTIRADEALALLLREGL